MSFILNPEFVVFFTGSNFNHIEKTEITLSVHFMRYQAFKLKYKDITVQNKAKTTQSIIIIQLKCAAWCFTPISTQTCNIMVLVYMLFYDQTFKIYRSVLVIKGCGSPNKNGNLHEIEQDYKAMGVSVVNLSRRAQYTDTKNILNQGLLGLAASRSSLSRLCFTNTWTVKPL